MTNPNDSVYPKMNELLDCDDGAVIVYSHAPLTKREYFAAMAMQGLLASSNFLDKNNPENLDRKLRRISRQSIALADDLIQELNVNIDELMKYYELLDKEKYDSDKS